MRIIKEGNVPPPTVYVGKCKNCQCVFECTRGDFLTKQEFDHWHWESASIEVVRCPTCFFTILTNLLKRKET